MSPQPLPHHLGASVSYNAGSARITLTRQVEGFYVETTQGPVRLDAWSRTYSSEAQARAAARHTAVAFLRWSTEQGIENRRAETIEVRDAIMKAGANRIPVRFTADENASIAVLEDELDGLASLADLARLEDLRSAMTLHLG